MNASPTVRTVAAAPGSVSTDDDERSLLARFELLLDREDGMLVERDAEGLAAIADERAALSERLAEVVRRRRVATTASDADEAELVDLYRRLHQRHEARGRMIRRRAERNSSALRVLAQAAGRTGLYQADGSVRPQFTGS
jgi:flagellar biosynthesis/type III secretory pathway chaperone